MYKTQNLLSIGKFFYPALFFVFFRTGPVSMAIDFRDYLPHTCLDDLNYTFPDYMNGGLDTVVYTNLRNYIIFYSEMQIELNIYLKVSAIYDISEEKMEFGMQTELVEFWKDPSMIVPNRNETATQALYGMPKAFIDCIWKPDTVFKNAKDSHLYKDTTANILYSLSLPRGNFLRKSRYRITVACSMKFHYYPMDVQKCYLEITLYRSQKSDVLMKWHKNPLKVKLESFPLNYHVKEGERTSSEITYKGYSAITQCLQAHFIFERSLSASFFNIYIPSFLVVSVSMVSFWLDIEAVPGRITLGVTAILTLSTQIVQARSGLPVLDYMTAMDIWLLGCLIIVFLSLVEFTFANSLSRRKRSNGKIDVKEPAWAERLTGSAASVKCRRLVKKPNSIIVKDNCLDRISRVVFPAFMVFFSIAYWVYYRSKI